MGIYDNMVKSRELQKVEQYPVEVIGRVRSCFVEKFGIPRQAGLAPDAVAELELSGKFSRKEMVQGLAQFSHIWVMFLFHQTVAEGWQAKIRPPRLGGRRRLGVFATRSPHRPNHIGISVVKLQGIRTDGAGVVLLLGGADLLDGTPVIDIKPYLVYSDCISNATGCFDDDQPGVVVSFTQEAAAFCSSYREQTGRFLQPLIEQVLVQDPRPASQRSSRTSFGMTLWDVNIRWRIEGKGFRVVQCRRLTGQGGPDLR